MWTWGESNPRPNSLTSVTLRFFSEVFVDISCILIHYSNTVVNVLMISQNIRFKAILSRFEAFSILSRVADPLKHVERLETIFYLTQYYTLPY